jgi:hypothetical protein
MLRVQAEQEHAVGGEPRTIARAAERLRCRRDDAERGAVWQTEARRGRGRVFLDGRNCTVVRGQPREHLLAGHDGIGPPVRGAADIHVLDEAHFRAGLSAELDQVDHLVVVVAARDDRVELQTREARAAAGFNAGEHGGQRVHFRELLKPVAAQRVQAHGETVQPGGLELGCAVGQQDAVGGERQVPHPRFARELTDEARQVTAEQRLAARHANPVDAELPEQVRQPADLLERQHVLLRQPEVFVLGHAVVAAQVAPIGDRQTQAPQRPPERVEQRHDPL